MGAGTGAALGAGGGLLGGLALGEMMGHSGGGAPAPLCLGRAPLQWRRVRCRFTAAALRLLEWADHKGESSGR
jgi:hypothetical protein